MRTSGFAAPASRNNLHRRMRSFTDAKDSVWTVTVGRESWGSFVLLFSPARGGDARKTIMAAESALDAEQELDRLSDDELRGHLDDSLPWADEPYP